MNKEYLSNIALRSFSFLAISTLLVLVFPVQAARGEIAMFFPATLPKHPSVLAQHDTNQNYVPSKKTMAIWVTSYNSEPGQTDSTPFITAFGTQVRDGIVATNYLPKGTKVRFPDLFGEKVFVVEDRMNVRYNKRMDIWSADKEFSRQFGARYLRMEVL